MAFADKPLNNKTMRLLNATLLAAMDTGNYDLYFLATIQDNFNGNVYLSAAPTGYELSDLELVLTVQMRRHDVPSIEHRIVLTRGVTIAGLHYTLSTSKFTIINSTWDGNSDFQMPSHPASNIIRRPAI